MKLAFNLLLPAMLVMLAGCASSGDDREPSTPADEVAVRDELLVSTEWLAAHLNDPGLVVLHVGRAQEEYAAAHVPGARFLPLSRIVQEVEGLPNELPPVARLDSVFEQLGVGDGSHVVLYGDQGGLSAARAFFTLDVLGHPKVALLDGGLEVWRAEGRALSTEQPAFTPASFTPRPRLDLAVTASWIRDRLDDPEVTLLDARPEAQFTGEEPGADVSRPGHIPGAENIFWKSLLVSDEQPLLKEPEQLHAAFEQAGIAPGNEVVTYCRTGVQASHSYFVARYLGYEPRMYDASFIDWSTREDYPVER